MNDYTTLWLHAFINTQLIEVSVGLMTLCSLNRRHETVKLSLPRLAITLFMANVLTHPAQWFIFIKLRRLGFSYEQYVIISELFAWLTEALWYFFMLTPLKRRVSLALLFSLAINSSSYLIGLCLG